MIIKRVHGSVGEMKKEEENEIKKENNGCARGRARDTTAYYWGIQLYIPTLYGIA